jgi:hypothetical protein
MKEDAAADVEVIETTVIGSEIEDRSTSKRVATDVTIIRPANGLIDTKVRSRMKRDQADNVVTMLDKTPCSLSPSSFFLALVDRNGTAQGSDIVV